MNYLAEIKAFYDRIELNPQPDAVIALWHALMSVANKAGWPDTFTVSTPTLCLRAGLNASALKRARKELAADGFIEWRQNGGNRAASYRMFSLVVQNHPQNGPQIGTVVQNHPQNEPQIGPINKQRLKLKDNPPISPLLRLEEFLEAYPLHPVNTLPARTEYCRVLLKDCSLTEQDLVDAARHYAEAMRILGRQERYIRRPENFLKEDFFVDYLTGNYVRPEPDRGRYDANRGLERADYGDMEELERELIGRR